MSRNAVNNMRRPFQGLPGGGSIHIVGSAITPGTSSRRSLQPSGREGFAALGGPSGRVGGAGRG